MKIHAKCNKKNLPTPLVPAKAVFCFPSELNIPKYWNMEKYQHSEDSITIIFIMQV